MQHAYSDIDSAFFFVSSDMPGANDALICRKTGRVYVRSMVGDSDEDYPEDACLEDYIKLPHKNDLDLGTRLVRRFGDEVAPHLAIEIREIFSRRGAYRRFKSLLEKKDMLDAWHRYEGEETEKALREWCRANHVELKD